jgi:hypothetical protein
MIDKLLSAFDRKFKKDLMNVAAFEDTLAVTYIVQS